MSHRAPFPSYDAALGLYIHIPFCKSRCHYCDFATFTGKEALVDSYLSALRQEMETHQAAPVSTVFIGGGTPTLLAPPALRRLLSDIETCFQIRPGAEFTVEANPETFHPETALALQEGGVNRLSFGLQTTEDLLLKRIGRVHDLQTFLEAYAEARRMGFSNINVDLIYGLPGQSLSDWRKTLETVLNLEPEHLSAYALTVEEGTAFKKQKVAPDPDLQADMYLWAHERLQSVGYHHYEISNFARPGLECSHNRLYWEDGDFLGVGCSAASALSGERRVNDPSLDGYIRRIRESARATVQQEDLKGPAKLVERLILRLRLSDGLAWPLEGPPAFGKVLVDYMTHGFLENSHGRLVPTARGWLLSNQLFVDLMRAAEATA